MPLASSSKLLIIVVLSDRPRIFHGSRQWAATSECLMRRFTSFYIHLRRSQHPYYRCGLVRTSSERDGFALCIKHRYATLGVWMRLNRGLKPTATGIAPLRG